MNRVETSIVTVQDVERCARRLGGKRIADVAICEASAAVVVRVRFRWWARLLWWKRRATLAMLRAHFRQYGVAGVAYEVL